MSACAEDGCERAVRSRGRCDTHRKGLSPLTEDDRWAKFVTPGTSDECWEWQGWRSPEGYGRFTLEGKQIPASRAAAIRAGWTSIRASTSATPATTRHA